MSSSEDEDALLFMQLVNLNAISQETKKKRHWVHPLWQKNKKFGIFNVYKKDLNLDDQKFKLFYRMKKETFSKLLTKLRPMLQKNTNFRKCVSPEESVLITLRYIIIARTSVVIWKVLQPTYLPNPTKETWVQSARRYWELWNLPNCVGSIDGKHIRIKRPPKSGSEFINYKGYFSIVLMAVSDADGCFLTIDVGEYGRNSDGRALKESNFGKKLVNSTLDLPDPSPLPGQDTNFPFYFAADEAFPLMCTIMKPYPKRGLTNRKRVFNGRLSRGRKSVECSFGMMSSEFYTQQLVLI
ncbi:unnamed protein product [Acanthoscelides obtectus]|uniref:DDE Tnp4 domain-containing protein n=1 Tax=Acanthoscelides obtectus TaxID=200917 RepID=A0A9P0VRJ2_ACAOB|nr:unnamed protein product [Acanthoscelides obtectus]CAK1687967.1 Protein ANTAGONIST OF LIKE HETEROCHROMATIN PROTEIN 1 [Acanthoscelides obtectus]